MVWENCKADKVDFVKATKIGFKFHSDFSFSSSLLARDTNARIFSYNIFVHFLLFASCSGLIQAFPLFINSRCYDDDDVRELMKNDFEIFSLPLSSPSLNNNERRRRRQKKKLMPTNWWVSSSVVQGCKALWEVERSWTSRMKNDNRTCISMFSLSSRLPLLLWQCKMRIELGFNFVSVSSNLFRQDLDVDLRKVEISLFLLCHCCCVIISIRPTKDEQNEWNASDGKVSCAILLSSSSSLSSLFTLSHNNSQFALISFNFMAINFSQ